MKQLTVSILGCGSRGCECYGYFMNKLPEKYKIVALCDTSSAKIEKYSKRFNIDEKHCFLDEDAFFEEKRSDLVVIATLDKDHVRQCIKALKCGYDVLLEKPISDSEEECKALLDAQKKYGGKVVVCHVLRYAPAWLKCKELLDNGTIGKLMSIEAIENVGWWHYAHSYVRGNWRRSEETTPMILAKCCHDLDYIQYFVGSKCKSISSFGDLTYFKKENQPEGAQDRCFDCKYVDSCPYSAKKIYIDAWNISKPENGWPYNAVTNVYPLTEQALYTALETGRYGRCVYACDNNVVDHQMTNMLFENGVIASLNMNPYSQFLGRIITFNGTHGAIEFNEDRNYIRITPFERTRPVTEIAVDKLVEGGHGHGGGDSRLVEQLYEMIVSNKEGNTMLEASIESHLMGIYAEKSRLEGGKTLEIQRN